MLNQTRPNLVVSIPYRLATNFERPGVYFYTDEFQFLIGWLQTLQIDLQRALRIIVSIPYRLATNKAREELESKLKQ